MSGYNGWENYETWCANLWLRDTKGSDDFWLRAAREAWHVAKSEKPFTRLDVAAKLLYEQLRDECAEQVPTLKNGLLDDLLGMAVSRINWHQIARSLLEDAGIEEEAKA